MRSVLFLLLSAAALSLASCGGYEAAQKAYNLGEYNKAAELFDAAQKSEKVSGRRAEECFLLGECYRHLGVVSKSAVAYQRALRLKYDDDIVMLRLADAYRAIGKFDEARDVYNAYYERHKTDRRVNVGRASASLAEEVWPELSNIKVTAENADSGYVVKPFREVNSKYSDFCPVYVGEGFDVVYFSSLRMEKKKRRANKITGQGGSTIYMSKVDGRGKWTVPQPLEEPFGGKGNDDGAAFVSADGRTMLFTRCPMNNQDGCPVHAYEIKREGGRWSEPVRIMPGADSTFMVAHPTLSPDGQVLYFVSDHEQGSFGGLDVWKSLRNVDGSWGPAQNLGPMVNTAGNEVFPSVRQDGTLYFSSDGHKGFGGLDLFKAVDEGDGRYHVSNLGLPINSAGDDFGITFVGLAEEGLFSSNRGNSKGYDDIYSFYLPPVILTIEARIGQSGKKAFADGNTKPKNRILRPSPSATAKAEASSAVDDARQDDFMAALEAETLKKSDPAPDAVAPVVADSPESSSAKQGAAKSASKTAVKKQSAKSSSATKKQGTATTKKSAANQKTPSATAKKTTTAKQPDAYSAQKKTATAASTVKKSNATSSNKAATKKRKFVPAPDAYVRIVGSDGTNVKIPADANGKISFVAEKDVRYVILSAAPGYANMRTEVSTEGINRSQTIRMTSLLDKVDL